jgi:flavin-dependent dehydrogenase
MVSMRDVIIVGGGPAGALCGERLARAGRRVIIFDDHLAWEKPCGGGLTHKAIARYPFLLEGPQPKKLIRTAELISSDGRRARLALEQPIVIYSRRVLNGLLLDRAAAAGCRLIRSHVSSLSMQDSRVHIRAADSEHDADFIVLAAGARNRLLPETTPISTSSLEMTLGYYLPADEDILKVKFLPGFEGYLWSFPRPGHLSIGICGKMTQNSSGRRRDHLHQFMREENLPIPAPHEAQLYSHLLPSPEADTLRQRCIAGRNWALAGDAAACVDPITGEGLYYAMRSGELLAETLLAGRAEEYPVLLRAEFTADLELAARIARRFFRGRFLGGAVTTRMVQFAQHSTAFRGLLRDLFSGTQNYSGLKRRLWLQLAPTLAEIAGSMLAPSAETEKLAGHLES